ncbi:HNH endonuclease family protein, partial [Escherichia coli]|uniref:HNH endonuclease family protein n=2 Tax=Enterobacteriaceae TaxID=543 RepID=UPI00130014CB
MRRLDAVDTTTVIPFLLYAYAELVPANVTEFDAILELLEAYLVRRMICGMTSKNYNRYFVELIKALDKKGIITAENVAGQMNKSAGDSTRFPDDSVLAAAITDLPFYGRLAQYKVRTILEALDAYAFNKKSEAEPLPVGLTIEHVMPQKWADNWPLCPDDKTDPLIEQKAIQRRDKLINTIGNLTLITHSLNPALSNSAWTLKRPELLKFSKLNLTQY